MNFAHFAIHRWNNGRTFFVHPNLDFNENLNAGDSEDANLPIGAMRNANREIGVPVTRAAVYRPRPRIFNCFTFLPPCLMSRFGYTAVSNLASFWARVRMTGELLAGPGPVGALLLR